MRTDYESSQTNYIVIRTRLCCFDRTQDPNMNAIMQYKGMMGRRGEGALFFFYLFGHFSLLAYPPTMYSRYLDKIITEEVNSVEIFRLLPKLITLFINIYWLEKYKKIQDKIEEAFRVILSYLIQVFPSPPHHLPSLYLPPLTPFPLILGHARKKRKTLPRPQKNLPWFSYPRTIPP